MLCLAVSGQQALFGQPVPQVRFDQSPVSTGATCTLAKSPDVPPEVLIGEDFTFRVRFKNVGPAGATGVGYGPFIDLVLDAGGANINKLPNANCVCDGIIFVKANMVDINGGAVPLDAFPVSAPCNPVPATVTLTHPFASPSQVPNATVPAGAQLVTLKLPFGSFDATQPEIVIEVTAHVSNLADVSPTHPLTISARGGFQFGNNSLDDAGPPDNDCPVVSDIDPSAPQPPPCTKLVSLPSPQWQAQAATTPTVMTVNKKYLGPEDETATGPNFTGHYQLTVNIADGQTINHLAIKDSLPSNLQFADNVQVTILGALASPVTSCSKAPPTTGSPVTVAAPPPGPGGVLTVQLCNPIPGLADPDEVVITFDFFIPEFDASGNPVLSPTCTAARSIDDVRAEGDWTPVDKNCDIGPVHVVSDVTSVDHTLLDKCLAIQKSVEILTDTGTAGLTPGDTLLYTLKFQLSDFKTAGNLKIQDILSDGQHFVPNSLTLSVTDQCGTTATSGSPPFPPAAVTVSTPPCVAGAPPPHTVLDIGVSDAMAVLAPPGPHQNGVLTGGFATSVASSTPATGKITFQTVVDDAYLCPVAPGHDQFVDKDDPLTNTVTLTADILANGGSCGPTIPASTGFTARDGSEVCIAIVTDLLQKSIYAVTRGGSEICGNTIPCATPDVRPGDAVTFRLKKTIPSSDAERLTIQDWLPRPVFDVADPKANGSPQTWNLIPTACVGSSPPAPGIACFLPDDDLSVSAALTASPPANPPTNSLTFDYQTFEDPTNIPRTIDLLFTLNVTNTPFADGLYLTNEARECEDNSFAVTFCQTAIAQLHLREPALKITKGVVSADKPGAIFSPPLQGGPVSFNPPGGPACPRFAGTIDSNYLQSSPINSNVLSGLDANDCVTFAVVVENTGGSPAYDIRLQDLFPVDSTGALDCFLPQLRTFCVTDGTGAVIQSSLSVGASFNTEVITLADPLPGLTPFTPPGKNIAVITFDSCVRSDIKPGCCDNVARVENYASTQGGPNFVSAGYVPPFQDTAQICILPSTAKSILFTSEPSTPGPPLPSTPEQVAIGEIIRYRLHLTVPETTAAITYTMKDTLPAGMSYLPGTATATYSSSSLSPQGPPVVTDNSVPCTPAGGGGGTVAFTLGPLSNFPSPTPDFIDLDFNALVCNVASNQSGTVLTNSFTLDVDGRPFLTSNSVKAVVVEPNITITKSATVFSPPPLTIGATGFFFVTLTNNGTATAFDVHLTDVLPDCLTGLNISTILPSPGVVGVAIIPSMTMLDMTIESIPVGGTVNVAYSANVKCLDCEKLVNTAKVTWTSLPGPFGTTVNPTQSSTPGASGLPNGERDGSGGVNDYAASATATLCCTLVADEKIECNPAGSYTYTFTATNFSNLPFTGVTFLPPAGVTITPNPITGSPFPLPVGASATLTVAINGATPGSIVCFTVKLSKADPVSCDTQVCVTIPPKCCVQAPPGLIAWYPLDEGIGATSVADIGGFGHVGTPKFGPVGPGGPLPNVPNPPYVVDGSLDFGSSGTIQLYVDVPNSILPPLDIGKGDFTIDGWIYDKSGPAPIVDKFDSATNIGYRLFLGAPVSATSATLCFTYGDGSSLVTQCPVSVPLQEWHHVAVTVQRKTASPFFVVTFYLDGVLQGGTLQIVPVGNIANGLDFFIGGFHSPPPVAGVTEIAIDELEIFSRMLDGPEILAIYSAGSAGKCKPKHRPGVMPAPARHPVRRTPFH